MVDGLKLVCHELAKAAGDPDSGALDELANDADLLVTTLFVKVMNSSRLCWVYCCGAACILIGLGVKHYDRTQQFQNCDHANYDSGPKYLLLQNLSHLFLRTCSECY